MLLGQIIKYALEKALNIKEWEIWSDSPFAFNGIPEHRSISQIVIYHDYKEIYIYTKEGIGYSAFTEIAKFGPYAVYPATYEKEEEGKYRVTPVTTDGIVIIGKYV